MGRILLETTLSYRPVGLWTEEENGFICLSLSTGETLRLTEKDAVLVAQVLFASVKKLSKRKVRYGAQFNARY